MKWIKNKDTDGVASKTDGITFDIKRDKKHSTRQIFYDEIYIMKAPDNPDWKDYKDHFVVYDRYISPIEDGIKATEEKAKERAIDYMVEIKKARRNRLIAEINEINQHLVELDEMK